MTMSDWAEREVKIACEKENPDRKDDEFDYGCSCYESALKAYMSILEDGHSGLSIKITKQILNRMIDGKVLTPIEDMPSIWSDCGFTAKGLAMYQCNRMSSLFKYVYSDGTIKYNDIDRIVCVENGGSNCAFHSGLVDDIINEMFPITMPYMPCDKPFKVICESFLANPKCSGDFDTRGILRVIKPDGEVVEINRFFREPTNLSECDAVSCNGWLEIGEQEYNSRKARKIK